MVGGIRGRQARKQAIEMPPPEKERREKLEFFSFDVCSSPSAGNGVGKRYKGGDQRRGSCVKSSKKRDISPPSPKKKKIETRLGRIILKRKRNEEILSIRCNGESHGPGSQDTASPLLLSLSLSFCVYVCVCVSFCTQTPKYKNPPRGPPSPLPPPPKHRRGKILKTKPYT